MQGETRAWELLAERRPCDVARRSGATWSAEVGRYVLAMFGLPLRIDPTARTITAEAPAAEWLLTNAGYFSRLSILHYLIGARDIPTTGRLVKPAELRAGQFFQGSHALPLDRIAARFSHDAGGFLAHAARFAGQPKDYGDAATELHPFPRVPVTLILWEEDEEFPARCELLFDAASEQQLPTDILWSVAMVCVLAMLQL